MYEYMVDGAMRMVLVTMTPTVALIIGRRLLDYLR